MVMNKYITNLDASPPYDYEGTPSYVYRDARDVTVLDSSSVYDTGLLNEKGGRILRERNEIGFNR